MNSPYPDEVIPGRVPLPYTQAPDWVSLSGVSPSAHSLHTKLAMHVSHNRGDALVWPGTDSLAALMGVARGDKVTKWLAELVAIEAIEIRRVGMPRRNIYIVHFLPPAGYAGPTTLQDWYARARPGMDAARALSKTKRDGRRAARAVGGTPPGDGPATAVDASQEPQVNAVTPDSGEQPVPPKSGEHVTPFSGQHVPPISGREQEEKNKKKRTSPPSPHADPPAPPTAARPGGEEMIDDETRKILDSTVGRVRQLRPAWSRKTITAAMSRALRDGRSAAAVAAAMVVVATDPSSQVPGRLNQEGPWWAVLPPRPVPATPPGPACPKAGHERNPAGACTICAADAKGVDRGPADPDAAPTPDDVAAVLADARARIGTAAADARKRKLPARTPARVGS